MHKTCSSGCWNLTVLIFFFFCSICSINSIQNLTKMPQINSLTGTNCNYNHSEGVSFKIVMVSPGQYGSVGWALSCKAKGHQFDSWSGHMRGLAVRSPSVACMRGNRSMFISHIDVSMFFSLSFSLPSPPSKT